MNDFVLTIGSLNYDFILRTDHLPRKGETLTAESFDLCSGGKGANQAVQCAKLGLRTYMAGAVGNDFMGEFMLDSLKKYKVDVSNIKIEEGSSGFAMANAAGKGNIFATIVKGANEKVEKEDINKLDVLFRLAPLVVLQLEIPTETVEYAIYKAKKNNCTILFNTAPAKPIGEKYLASCDFLVMNEVEASFYCNIPEINMDNVARYIQPIAKKMGNTCIITLGASGAIVSEKGSDPVYFPAFQTEAVETTGAGDSFVGGIVYGIINKLSMEETLSFASCCSAVTIRKPGGQPAMPYLKEVMPLREEYSQQRLTSG